MIRIAFAALLSLAMYSNSFSQILPSGPQVVTFFSDFDDTEQPYGLYIPKNFDSKKKYPLVIMLHGAGSNHRLSLRRVFGKSNAPGETDVEASRVFPEWNDVEYIVASPFARGTMGYQGVAEKDVYDILADVKKRFNIDEDRTFLTGLSMGGGGTLWIGLTRPDIWAALAPVCPAPPAGTENYLRNSFNLPMYFFHGDADQAVPVSVSRDLVKKLKENGTQVSYDEYPGVEHNSWEKAYADGAIFKWFDQFKRKRFPEQVKFSTARYEYSSAYWVKVDDFAPSTVAEVEVRFTGDNQLEVTVKNVNGFTLNIAEHPRFKKGQPLQVTLNGKKQKVTPAETLSFWLKDGKWTQGKIALDKNSKNVELEGPIAKAISERHVYVYGTEGNPSQDEIRKRYDLAFAAANWSVFRNPFLGRVMAFPRILSDKEVRESDLKSANIILFGTRETNSIIKKYADALPLELASDATDTGLIYVYPLNGKYVVINSGLPWWNNDNPFSFYAALPFQQLSSLKDFVVFNKSAATPIVEGFFDKNWKLSSEQKSALQSKGIQVK